MVKRSLSLSAGAHHSPSWHLFSGTLQEHAQNYLGGRNRSQTDAHIVNTVINPSIYDVRTGENVSTAL